MEPTTNQLADTLSKVLDTISVTLHQLQKADDCSDKVRLADVVKKLARSQQYLTESLDSIADSSIDFINDFQEMDDDEINSLMDTKQIQFNPKDDKKKTSKKKNRRNNTPNDDNKPL